MTGIIETMTSDKIASTLRIAREVLQTHGLSDWKVEIDGAKRRAGICRFDKSTISLASGYISKASESEIMNTILHEVAHALVGPHHGHDKIWKRQALRIGCDGARCHNVSFTEKKWEIYCDCGKVKTTRHVVRTQILKKICKYCRGGLKKRLINS